MATSDSSQISPRMAPTRTKQAVSLFWREMRIMIRGSAAPASWGFFLLSGCIAPLALGPDTFLLTSIAPGLIWILAILAALLGMDSLYQEELTSGGFAILRLTSMPMALMVLMKACAYWLTVCVPLILVSPLIILVLGGSYTMAWMMMVSLSVGTPALVLIGSSLAALCVGLKRGTGLVIFLALPFFSPALIFGTRVLNEGIFNMVALLFLAAFSLQALIICPFITAAALRQHME